MKNNYLNQKPEQLNEKKLDWHLVQSEMKVKFGKDIYESWIRKIEFVSEFNDYILISVSTRFIRDWITSRYLDQILQIVKSYNKNINRIEFSIDQAKDNNKNVFDFKNQSTEKNENVSFIKETFTLLLKFSLFDI